MEGIIQMTASHQKQWKPEDNKTISLECLKKKKNVNSDLYIQWKYYWKIKANKENEQKS